jgi:hypothetical protein
VVVALVMPLVVLEHYAGLAGVSIAQFPREAWAFVLGGSADTAALVYSLWAGLALPKQEDLPESRTGGVTQSA